MKVRELLSELVDDEIYVKIRKPIYTKEKGEYVNAGDKIVYECQTGNVKDIYRESEISYWNIHRDKVIDIVLEDK